MNWLLRNLIIISLLTFGVFLFIFFSETGEIPQLKDHWEGLLLAVFLANLGGIGLYFSNLQFNKIIPWNKKRALRFVAEITSGLIVFALLAFIFYYTYVSPNIAFEEAGTFWVNYWDGIVKFGIILFVLIYIFSLVNFSMFSYNQYTVVQIESLRVDRDQVQLRFEALKSQLNPHFLFNALNTISSLLYKDIRLAEQYIRKLASTYRYILKTEDKHLVKVKDELDMVRSFFYMQQIKYEECISLDINIPTKLNETFIPPLTLQMLVENALKHNLINEDKPLRIEIFSDTDYIVVKNNLIEKPILLKVGNDLYQRPQENGSHKIGLENIRKRYHYFARKDIDIIRNEHFIVRVPIIKQAIER